MGVEQKLKGEIWNYNYFVHNEHFCVCREGLGSINIFTRTVYTELGSENFTWWLG